jgi:hypothetical protein
MLDNSVVQLLPQHMERSDLDEFVRGTQFIHALQVLIKEEKQK